MTKNIGIIGSGAVAQTLAKGFIQYGYDVTVGSRTPEKLADFVQSNPKIKSGTFLEAAAFGEIVVIATKGAHALEALALAQASNLNGKTVIDVTNPIDDTKPPTNGVLHYYTTLEESQLERLQKAFPDANFVKAFNSIGNAFMINPQFNGGTPSMFICGNDEKAKSEVAVIVQEFGFEVEDMGKMEAARAIEPLCILWCIPGFLRNEWNHGFKLLKK